MLPEADGARRSMAPEEPVAPEVPEELDRAFQEVLQELHRLWRLKQQSYGPHNIAAFGERGCLIRANDKIQRLIRLVWSGLTNPLDDETIEDTWKDLANYAIMAIMCRRGEWPGVDPS